MRLGGIGPAPRRHGGLGNLATALALAAVTALAGCGGEPEEQAAAPPAAAEPAPPLAGVNNLPRPRGRMPAALTPEQLAQLLPPDADQNQLVIRTIEINPTYFSVLVNFGKIDDPLAFAPYAQGLCGDREICTVGIWASPRDQPRAAPIPGEALRSIIFRYGRNRGSNYEAPLWNCEIWDTMPSASCMPRPL